MAAASQTLSAPTGARRAEEQMHRQQSRMLAGVVILLFLLIGFAYSLVVPPFETPDELFHFGFSWHIAQGNGLPVQSEVETGPWAQEGSQAPLYYLLTGWMTSPLDQSDFASMAVRNPRANIGDPLDPGNKNFMLYSGQPQPLAGSNLALHIGRWFSLLLGAVTLWCVYLTAELAVKIRAQTTASYGFAVVTTAFVAAIPQFLFISASFTNDTLIITACAGTVYLLARLLAKPSTAPIHWYEWVALGALIGIAALSKLQGLGLIPLAGLVVLFLAWRRRSWRLIVEAALLVALPAVAISGWWYVRNILLYGDWSGLGHLTAINGRRTEPLTLEDFWPEFRGLRYSFWGLFGWFNILLPNWFYLAADLLSVIGALGVVGVLLQRVGRASVPLLEDRPLRIIVLLVIWAVLIFLLLIYWTLQATGSQGRLVFPGLIAYGILLPLGIDFWLQWLSRRTRYLVWTVLLVTMLCMSGYALLWLLPDAYNAPSPVSGLPQGVQPANITYEAEVPVQLVAVEVGDDRYRPGERAPVTLYWRTDQALQEDYQLFIQFLDENGREVANLTSHPGWGRNPTTFWQPGALYADRYEVLIKGPMNASSPLLARVYTGLIDPASADADNLPLRARAADGTEVTPFVAAVELAPWHLADPTETPLQESDATFGGVIKLGGYHVPQAVSLSDSGAFTVTMDWQALGQPLTDYTAFVHVLDAQGEQVAGYDQAPAADRFPTSRWRGGDRIFSSFSVSLPPGLPPGEYQLWTGLYETASAGVLRLPVTGTGGLPSGDGQVQIGTITVQRSQ